jgi:hypothetical protein
MTLERQPNILRIHVCTDDWLGAYDGEGIHEVAHSETLLVSSRRLARAVNVMADAAISTTESRC